MRTIYFLDTVHHVLADRLSNAGFSCVDASALTFEQCCEQLKDAEGIVIRSRFPMDETLLRFAPRLKFIARSGAGMENIDEAYCSDRGITLLNAPEGNRNAVGEQALGMLLSLMSRIGVSHNQVRTGKWDREGNRGTELDGKTVGIIGYGNNGSAFARKLRGFDVTVLAYDKYKSGYGDDFVIEATLEAVIRKSDVISFHIPQNSETIHFADQEFFDGLGRSVFLLNLSRGKIVSAKALIRAIESGVVLGAGLDVNEFEKASFETFFEEAMPEELGYLLQSDKVILTPHIGGWTHESYFRLSDVLADKILEFYEQ